MRDFAFRQYFREVIRCGVLYRAVGGAAYFARGYDIPESNSVAQEHSALFVDAFGDIFTEYRGKHAPESVLRMRIVKSRFARFYRWKAAENKNARIFIPYGRDIMHEMFACRTDGTACYKTRVVYHEIDIACACKA